MSPAGTDGKPGIGALLLGACRDGELVHCGKVGTGPTDRRRGAQRRRLDGLVQTASRFAKLSTAERKGAIG